MLENYYAVIMAGGGGTRLWPLSRKNNPKQMLRLVDEWTLYQSAVNRLHGIFPPERIFVVTVEEQAEKLQSQSPTIPAENFLLEPMPRGTASVVGLGAVALKDKDPGAVMAVLTADHVIANQDNFHHLLSAAHHAAQDGHLVTLGITPTHPSTGYGYIQQGDCIATYLDLPLYAVSRFKEKPSESVAKQMFADGRHAWNSGMFVWRVDRILEEFAHQMPALNSGLTAISDAWNQRDRDDVIHRIWPDIQPQTIDYGIMENANRVTVLPAADLGWNDVGSWDALFDVLPSDKNGNIVVGGEHIQVDTHGSLVYMNQDHRLVVTIGVDDLVIVDTGDVVLISRKDQAQKVRQVVQQLKQSSKLDFV